MSGVEGAGLPPAALPPALLPAVAAAQQIVAHLVALGVEDVVLAPGSRSAPLAYALAAADAAGQLTLHVRVDERTAAFFALGLSRGSAAAYAPTPRAPHATRAMSLRYASSSSEGALRPVAVVTTSGTAAANLHPAVLEAHHSQVPLVVLTADRPHELRGTGANQTTDQVGLYGTAVRYAVDLPAPTGRPGEGRDTGQIVVRALAAARGTRSGHPGPVHLNVAFRDPIAPSTVPDALPIPVVAAVVPASAPVTPGPGPAALPDRATVVVAGDGAGPDARRLAEARGWPLLSEASSGSAGGPNLVAAHHLVLGVLGERVERVVVVGRPTLSRPVQQLLGRETVEVVVVAPGAAPWPDAARNASAVVPGIPEGWLSPRAEPGPDVDPWLQTWQAAGGAARQVIDAHAHDEVPMTGLSVAAAVAEASGPEDVLVIGSSSPARDLDLVADWAEPPLVVANRGLAGIDGTVSTALGVALVAARAGRRTRALLGDLTFLHDAGGLLRGPHEPPVSLQIVVVNDDGGSIFSTLEQGGLTETPTGAAAFERVFATPHGANLAQLCAGYGVDHQLVHDTGSLRHVLGPGHAPAAGVTVIEVRVDRHGRRAAGEALAAEVRARVGAVVAGR